MKINQLRKIIKEEVKSAIKEELQDLLTEAVKIASKPETNNNRYKPVTQKDIKQTWSTGKMSSGTTPIQEMLSQTRASMTGEEYRNVFAGNVDMVQKPNFASSMASNMGMTDARGPMPGMDISKLDFVKKAGAVYNKSVEKDKQKYGVA